VDKIQEFENEKKTRIKNYSSSEISEHANKFFIASQLEKYSYNFTWLDRPIIQYPTDIVAIQEIIWRVKPDLIIETGIAHGGSLILSASMLIMIDLYEDGSVKIVSEREKPRKVIGIDIDIRLHNRKLLEQHLLYPRLSLIEGSSIDPNIVNLVHNEADGYKNILILLDSHHTHDHVLAELEAYAPLTGKGSYCVVFDGIAEDLPKGFFSDRPWDKGNNPKTALWEYLHLLETEGRTACDGLPLHFEIEKETENKLLITAMPDGLLRRVKDIAS